jgi:flagellar hook-length control protein FliK
MHLSQIKNHEPAFETNLKNSSLKSFDKSSEYNTATDFLAFFQLSLSTSNFSPSAEIYDIARQESTTGYSYESKNSYKSISTNQTDEFKSYVEENNKDKKETKPEITSENTKNIKDSREPAEIKEADNKNKKPSALDLSRKEIFKQKEQTENPGKNIIETGKEIISGIKKGFEVQALKKAGENVKSQPQSNIESNENILNKQTDIKKFDQVNLFNNKKPLPINEDDKKIISKELQNEKPDIKSARRIQFNKEQVINKQNIVDSKFPEVNVSRETIFAGKEIPKTNESVDNKSISIKPESIDKSVNLAGLKSEMNSDLSSNQNQQGFSTNLAEKMGSMGKSEDSSIVKHNLQQQIDQLLQRARVIIKDSGNASLSTKLNPKELGEISIKLVLSGGKLTGKFTVENDIVQKELNDKLNQLFSELKSDGYDIDGFQVDVKSQAHHNHNSNERFLDVARDEFNNSFFSKTNNENITSEYNLEKNPGNIYA